MGLLIKRKFPHLILAAYLAIAIIGAFSFSAIEPLREIDFWVDKPASSNFLEPIDHSINCLAEGTAIMSRARGYSFSLLRNGSLRVLMAFGLKNTGSSFFHASLAHAEKMNSLSTKYTIPLKLRI
ncbi:hypothetical protein [Leadbettera azotonutricia]|uniref:Uncharacterized protein n=1 Tax=Leadbettera azotonutricia (strain ATCC BAA-888 / DSM 13862 / ZAS-9) TaxID=545695 RepID=F5YE31_LEAAZ|nr:hypothetical protein [Leadbettera azotonutricia]AEF82369.1 hypothetical protein TREAZ_1522 [Leadbettera azotonutricia ZAS-9]